MRSLFENGDAHRLENQDSKMGKVDAELARARDLRDVSARWLTRIVSSLIISGTCSSESLSNSQPTAACPIRTLPSRQALPRPSRKE